jgi:hypothetical protein
VFQHSAAVSYLLLWLNDSIYFPDFLDSIQTDKPSHNGIPRDLKWFPFNVGSPASFWIKGIEHVTCGYLARGSVVG